MTFDALQPLADRGALYQALRADALISAAASLGEYRWDADLSVGTLTFSPLADPSQRMVCRAGLVATLAPGPRSMLWASAHPQSNDPLLAERLRTFGTQPGGEALVEPELPFPADVVDQTTWMADTAAQVAAAAVEIAGRGPAFVAAIDGGTLAVLLLEAAIPPLTVSEAVAALPRLLPTLALRDPRTSVWGLARLAGWSMAWTDDAYSGATVSDTTATATFRFDELGQLTAFS